jgi:TrmH family RNA methyltransferase
MPRIRIVLVEPQIPANLGFVARCLDNFGLDDWIAVGGCAVEGTEAQRTGSPAPEVLAALRRADSLEEAVADCDLVIGLTARDGFRRAPLSLHGMREGIGDLVASTRVALVFGREDRGLENRECERCSHLVTIPTAGLSSFNLSHAVAITLYEWFRGRVQRPPVAQPSLPQEFRWASSGEKAKFVARALADLEAAAFRHHGDQLHGALRRLAALPIEGRDLRMLNRIARHAEWQGGVSAADEPREEPRVP